MSFIIIKALDCIASWIHYHHEHLVRPPDSRQVSRHLPNLKRSTWLFVNKRSKRQSSLGPSLASRPETMRVVNCLRFENPNASSAPHCQASLTQIDVWFFKVCSQAMQSSVKDVNKNRQNPLFAREGFFIFFFFSSFRRGRKTVRECADCRRQPGSACVLPRGLPVV